MAQTSKRRYVFHFDLNNTILMQDKAKGLGLVDNVRSSFKGIELNWLFSLCRFVALFARVLGVSSVRRRSRLAMKHKLKRIGFWHMTSWLSLSLRIHPCSPISLMEKMKAILSVTWTTLMSPRSVKNLKTAPTTPLSSKFHHSTQTSLSIHS